jgi:hypothetical protein
VRIVVKIFGGLVALWVVFLLVGLLLPGRYRVERSAVIAAAPSAVFKEIADLKEWRAWGVWFRRDPGMKIAYSPATTEVGAWSQWTSRSQGDGKMTITSVRAPDYFEYRMEFTDMGMVSRGTVELAPAGAGRTRVTMAMEGDLGRSPVNRWFGVFMDRLVGPDFAEGLANMRRLCEGPPR